MRLANATLEEMTEALNRGWAERDSRVAMLLQKSAPASNQSPEAAIKEVLDADKPKS
jgi:3-hydroxyisobutyrate dehydrogenase